MNGALHDAISFQIAELLDKHLLGYGRDRSLQLRETHDRRFASVAAKEVVEYDQLPPPFQKPKSLGYQLRRTISGVKGCRLLTFWWVPNRFISSCHSSSIAPKVISRRKGLLWI